MRLAIIRLSSLGDVISTAIFLRLIKGNAKSIHITFVVDTAFKEILQDSPYIDEICDIPLRKSKKNKRLIFGIAAKLRALQRFDVVIDFQGLLKSAIIGKMLKSDEFIGYAKNGVREKIASLFYTKKIDIAYDAHILVRQYEILRSVLNLDSTFDFELLNNRKGVLQPSRKASDKIERIIESSKTNVLFILEASKREKEYPLDLFYEVALALKSSISNLKIYLIWDKKEEEIRELGARDSIFCVLDRLNLDEIKALLANMQLAIGGDTGITHLAFALCTPAITLYGNTPLKRVILKGERFISISHANLSTTIKGDFSITKIKSKEIVESALYLLEGN